MGLADLTIGRYYPASSIIHNLDARIKLISVLLISVAVFGAKSIFALLFAFIFTLFVFSISKLPVKWIYKSIKPILYLIIFSFLIQIFFTPGETLFKYSFIKISYEGVALGFYVTLRVIVIVIIGSILTFTTEPISIADAIESLLSPLKIIKLPVHEIALTITLALRFIPELLAEAQQIAFAQAARGANFKTGNIFIRAKNMIPLFIPLLVSSFVKADDLGKAMESRSYNGSVGRTKLYEDRLKSVDIVSISFVLMMVIITVLIK